MILSEQSLKEQLPNMLHKYPELQVAEQKTNLINLKGYIHVYRSGSNFTINSKYYVRISIPFNTNLLPSIFEIGNQLSPEYPHKYANGKLCLETDINIAQRFKNGLSLIEWMDEYVETYFFSYEYYKRFGTFPFGEHKHGFQGLLENYSSLFHENDLFKTYKIMKSISQENYRGHMLCPCGSNKKIRNCHKQFIKDFYMDENLKQVVRKNYETIAKEVSKTNV